MGLIMTIISEEQQWTTLLQNAGLPVKRAYKETFDDGSFVIQAEFTTGLTTVQNELFLSLTNPAKLREQQARLQAKAISNWSTWTEQQALDWLQTNIGDPLNTPIPPNPMTVQQIRAVLVSIVDTMKKQYDAEKAMARMIVALRNKTWSDLPD
jgi:hypothetical protein